MFIIYGTTNLTKTYRDTLYLNCPVCRRQAPFRLSVSRRAFTLFFIPTFIRWNYHYYLQDSTCGTTFEIDRKLGKELFRGRQVDIYPEQMRPIRRVMPRHGMVYGNATHKRCNICGTPASFEHKFCMKCGTPFPA